MVDVREREVEKERLALARRSRYELGRRSRVPRSEAREVYGGLYNLQVLEEREPVSVLSVRAALGVVGRASARGERQAKEVIEATVCRQELVAVALPE